MEVEPLHPEEALARLVFVEFDLVGELLAELGAALVEAGEEQAVEALVADADILPELVVEPDSGSDVLLGARVLLQALELRLVDLDRVGPHLLDVEDVAARVAALLIDAEAHDVGAVVRRRLVGVARCGDADHRSQHGGGGEQGEDGAFGHAGNLGRGLVDAMLTSGNGAPDAAPAS